MQLYTNKLELRRRFLSQQLKKIKYKWYKICHCNYKNKSNVLYLFLHFQWQCLNAKENVFKSKHSSDKLLCKRYRWKYETHTIGECLLNSALSSMRDNSYRKRALSSMRDNSYSIFGPIIAHYLPFTHVFKPILQFWKVTGVVQF